MKNRKPYDLRRVLYVYNIGQVIYNGVYFAVVGTKSTIPNSLNLLSITFADILLFGYCGNLQLALHGAISLWS